MGRLEGGGTDRGRRRQQREGRDRGPRREGPIVSGAELWGARCAVEDRLTPGAHPVFPGTHARAEGGIPFLQRLKPTNPTDGPVQPDLVQPVWSPRVAYAFSTKSGEAAFLFQNKIIEHFSFFSRERNVFHDSLSPASTWGSMGSRVSRSPCFRPGGRGVTSKISGPGSPRISAHFRHLWKQM